MALRRPNVNLAIRLPLITIGIDDVGGVFGSRKKRGPFLIISRACGMALDTHGRKDDNDPVTVHPTTSGRGQLWYEVETGLINDAGPPSIQFVLRNPNQIRHD